ncbi:MAG TPA: hypothetical protein VK492_08290 [Chitinophagaceae bacterium]|nr:hypothetical protein [Chitinophagaceae bacterium]
MAKRKTFSKLRTNLTLLSSCLLVLLFFLFKNNQFVSYSLLFAACFFLITKWLYDWKILSSIDSQISPARSTTYDIQFKKLAKYLLLICLFYITFSACDFYRKSKKYIGEISLSPELVRNGYTPTNFALHLTALKEELQDFQETESTEARRPSESDYSIESSESTFDFEVQGFSFPLTSIGYAVGSYIWPNKKRSINIALLSDTVCFQATVQITNNAIQTFQEFFDDPIEKPIALTRILRKIEYTILEATDPYVMAYYYMVRNDPMKALAILPKKEKTAHNKLVLARHQARIYSRMYEFDTASFILRQLPKRQQNDPDVLNELGVIKSTQYQNDSAIQYFRQAMRIDNNFGFAFLNMGNYYYYDSLVVDSAIYYFQESLKHSDRFTKSDLMDACFRLSDTYRIKGELIKSQQYFIKACEIDPISFERLVDGTAMDLLMDEDSIKSLVSRRPDYLPGLFVNCTSLGAQFYADDKYAQALLSCSKKIGHIAPVEILLADFYFQNKNYDLGNSLINSAILHQPNNYIAFYTLAKAYFEKDLAQAEYAIRKSVEINPYFARAGDLLIKILATKGSEAELIAYVQKIADQAHYDGFINSAMGNIYFHKKKWLKSAYHYRLAISSPGGPEDTLMAYFRLGQSYYQEKVCSLANQYFDSCLRYDPPLEMRKEISKMRQQCNY